MQLTHIQTVDTLFAIDAIDGDRFRIPTIIQSGAPKQISLAEAFASASKVFPDITLEVNPDDASLHVLGPRAQSEHIPQIKELIFDNFK